MASNKSYKHCYTITNTDDDQKQYRGYVTVERPTKNNEKNAYLLTFSLLLPLDAIYSTSFPMFYTKFTFKFWLPAFYFSYLIKYLAKIINIYVGILCSATEKLKSV